MSITASEARKRLFPLIEEVSNNRTTVEIVSKAGSVTLVATDEYRSMEETIHLLRSPANAARLLAAVADIREGRALIEKPVDDLHRLAEENGANGT
ncbi:antitoxin YefM [Streptomyces sp. V4I23]|uniref:type II toxin-antitoxin system Phd/YefM family antitoxin n=1 Tax=Streptomyces sp. V4I23 TaxID=3042282 RepID=UPI002784D593|nr:type II toxin-antitoxin system prevent-host-death family antitoxin [Streptomyces sp. V4I23]MDQ1008157.1 antitoxin YefM [Streptomyces sp. V4I23]